MNVINQSPSTDSMCPSGFELIDLDQNSALPFLKTAQIIDGYLTPYGSNHTFVIFLDVGEKKCIRAIYKPEKGERPLRDFPLGTLHKRELASASLSKLIGWPNIPLTISRDGPHGVGIVLQYINHNPEITYFELRDDISFQRSLEEIAVFDLLANNTDRKAGHCILDTHNKIWSIDHGLTFHQSFKLRTVMVEFWGKEFSQGLIPSLYNLNESLNKTPGNSSTEISSLISGEEFDSLKFRLEYLLQNPVFPIFDLNFNIPYPLI